MTDDFIYSHFHCVLIKSVKIKIFGHFLFIIFFFLILNADFPDGGGPNSDEVDQHFFNTRVFLFYIQVQKIGEEIRTFGFSAVPKGALNFPNFETFFVNL